MHTMPFALRPILDLAQVQLPLAFERGILDNAAKDQQHQEKRKKLC